MERKHLIFSLFYLDALNSTIDLHFYRIAVESLGDEKRDQELYLLSTIQPPGVRSSEGILNCTIPSRESTFKTSTRSTSPCYEVTENERHFLVLVDVPGIKPKTLNIELEDDRLLHAFGECRKKPMATMSTTSLTCVLSFGETWMH